MWVSCALENEDDVFKIKPFPGGKAAQRQGCTCPYQPVPNGRVVFNSECPVHELEKVLKL